MPLVIYGLGDVHTRIHSQVKVSIKTRHALACGRRAPGLIKKVVSRVDNG